MGTAQKGGEVVFAEDGVEVRTGDREEGRGVGRDGVEGEVEVIRFE